MGVKKRACLIKYKDEARQVRGEGTTPKHKLLGALPLRDNSLVAGIRSQLTTGPLGHKGAGLSRPLERTQIRVLSLLSPGPSRPPPTNRHLARPVTTKGMSTPTQDERAHPLLPPQTKAPHHLSGLRADGPGQQGPAQMREPKTLPSPAPKGLPTPSPGPQAPVPGSCQAGLGSESTAMPPKPPGPQLGGSGTHRGTTNLQTTVEE